MAPPIQSPGLMSAPEREESMPFPGGRLQRPAKARSRAVLHFRQVLARHLVTMLVVAVVTGLGVASVDDWKRLLSPLIAHPVHYLAMCVAIVAGIAIYHRVRGIPWSAAQVGWVGYLFLISVVEEWAFRVFLPLYLVDDFGARASALLSSVFFGALHYFTLRWRLTACLLTTLGGLGFSRLLDVSGDLALVILVHWIVTFLNTPRPPVGVSR
jgi:membrane protease YdiL (CAAX protease family)